MDNKITKKRLSNFLSYEWITIIVMVVVSIIAWELLYGIMRVKVTPGQEFRVFYDIGLDSIRGDSFNDYLSQRGTFSYDVLEFESEGIVSSYEVLDLRLSAQQGDIIFTNKVEKEKQEFIRAKHVIDRYDVYCLTDLLTDAQNYLRSFLNDGVTEEGAEFNFENLSKQKIEAGFSKRMKKDNRVRKSKDYNAYLQKEYDRIEKLCKDVADYKYILEKGPEELFYRYTRYEQLVKEAEAENSRYVDDFKELYQAEIDEGRENYIYGINMEALKGGEIDASTYVSMMGEATAKDTVLVVFDMQEYQPDLQYETVSFIVENVRLFSDIL